MKIHVRFKKSFIKMNWIILVLFLLFSILLFIGSILYLTDLFSDNLLWSSFLRAFVIAFALYFCFSTLIHSAMALYPYLILKEKHLEVRVFSKPFQKIIKELPYAELQLYPTLRDSEEVQKRCSVTKIGSIDPLHSVAIKYTDEIYLITVDDPFKFREELANRINTAIKSNC